MGTYEKLVKLANFPCGSLDNLTDITGQVVLSSKQVIESLKNEFLSDPLISSLSIDERQACETMVSDT